MSNYESFEKYLESKQYNEIHAAISRYIQQKGRSNGFYSNTVLDPSYFKVDDIHVRTVHFYAGGGNQITFKAAVEADVILKGMGKRDYEADEKSCWYTVSFTGILLGGLNMVTITNVEEYCAERFNKENSLSRFMVPYLYSADLEQEAEKFLQQYCPCVLESPMAVPIEVLLDNMCLDMYYAPLPDNIFGKTYFSEAAVEVYDTGSDEDWETKTIEVDPGTILINPKVYFMRNIGSENNTIVHECVHWDRHHRFFELQKLLNSELSSIECSVSETAEKRDGTLEGTLQWMEWQANALTPKILLPAKTTTEKMKSVLETLYRENPDEDASTIMEMAVSEIAEFFKVSKYAAKIRVVELGFVQATGVLNYVDGHYLPNFSFAATSVEKGETFIIDSRNAIFEATMDATMRSFLSRGDFVYVDHMFCINDPKYIEELDDEVHLTDYARQHVDECCIKFRQKFKKRSTSGDGYYSLCSLCRDIDASSYCEPETVDDKTTQSVAQRAEQLKKLRQEGARINEIYSELPMSFHKTLDAHIKRLTMENPKNGKQKKLTNLEIASRTGFSEDYIADLRKNDRHVSMGTIGAICIALHLHPKFSRDLIQKSGNHFAQSEEGFMHEFIIDQMYMDSLDSCNEILKSQGFATWGGKALVV